jgi:hypothetical protein
VSTKKDGTERLNFTAFYEALLEARGVSLGDSGGSPAMSSRSSSAANRSSSFPWGLLRSEISRP